MIINSLDIFMYFSNQGIKFIRTNKNGEQNGQVPEQILLLPRHIYLRPPGESRSSLVNQQEISLRNGVYGLPPLHKLILNGLRTLRPGRQVMSFRRFFLYFIEFYWLLLQNKVYKPKEEPRNVFVISKV